MNLEAKQWFVRGHIGCPFNESVIKEAYFDTFHKPQSAHARSSSHNSPLRTVHTQWTRDILLILRFTDIHTHKCIILYITLNRLGKTDVRRTQ
jgi:hypothetical protein